MLLTPEQKELRKLRKALLVITTIVMQYEAEFAKAIQEPSSPERGRKLAFLTNALCYANDQIRGSAGVNIMKDKKKLPPGRPAFLVEWEKVERWMKENRQVLR